MGRRFDERYVAQLPIRIWGMDTSGRPFSVNTKTVDITHSGARVGGFTTPINRGDMVGVQCGNEKARFKVIWVGANGGPREAQIGVHCAEPGKYIWGVKLPAKTWDIDPHPIPGMGQAVPLAGSIAFPPMQTPTPGAPKKSVPDPKHAVRRVHKRVSCTGPVVITPESGAAPMQATLSDISVSGCYVETQSTLSVHSRIHLAITIDGKEVHASGIVRTSHPGVGMGLSFTTLGLHDRDELSMIIAKLSHEAPSTKPAHLARAMAASSKGIAHPAPMTRIPEASPVVPQHSSSPAPRPRFPMPAATSPSGRTSPAGGRASTAPGAEGEGALSERLQRMGNELHEVQDILKRDGVDPRLLSALHDSMDHARQVAWTIEQWLHLQSQNRDPFEALAELEVENIRRTEKLAKNISVNIDATEIATHTPGLEELYLAIEELRMRLARLLKKEPVKDKSLRSPMRAPEGPPTT
jgi:PilZ domain-containing protein